MQADIKIQDTALCQVGLDFVVAVDEVETSSDKAVMICISFDSVVQVGDLTWFDGLGK